MKHRILSLSPDLCPPKSPVDPETPSITEFGNWCRKVCTLYRTHVRDISDLMQRIRDTPGSISQNIEAVGQWRKPGQCPTNWWRRGLIASAIRAALTCKQCNERSYVWPHACLNIATVWFGREKSPPPLDPASYACGSRRRR